MCKSHFSSPFLTLSASNSFISPHPRTEESFISADDFKISSTEKLESQTHHNLSRSSLHASPTCGGFHQGECRVYTCATHITASLHGNSHLGVSGATVCVHVCAEYSISVLEFAAWCGVISMLHICGNVR